MYRRNQYDLWDIEDHLQGKAVLLVSKWIIEGQDTLRTENGIYSILSINDSLQLQMPLKTPKEPGLYYLRLSIKTGWLPATINSDLMPLIVK